MPTNSKRTWLRILSVAVSLLLATLALLVFCVREALPPAPDPVTAIADADFDEAIAAARASLDPLLEEFPSLSVAVAVEGRLVWSEARGWADLTKRIPATPTTLYRIYSVSKPLTAAAAARLAGQDRLALDEPLRDLLTDLPESVRPITPRQIGGHQSGMRHYREGEISAWGKAHCDSVREALPFFLDNDPVESSPGERATYSSYAYVLLSRVVEAAAEQPYLTALDELVLSPAGMTDTRLDDPRVEIQRRSEFYMPMWLGRVMADPKEWDNTCKWGAGGLLSTSEDLARFGAALLNSSTFSPELRDLMLNPMSTANGEETSNSFGLTVGENKDGVRVALHSGGAMGARSALYLRPDNRIAVALLANLIGDRLTDEASEVARIFAAHLP
jgi:serine beta-lactamase-like protein LACTB